MSVQHKDLTGDDLHQAMPIGDDADKSASPISGDWYLGTDTEKLYVCFADGSWEEFGVDSTALQDADADTKVEVEQSADEDKVRVTTGGTQRAVFDSNGLTLESGASVNEFSTDGTLTGNSDNAVPTEKAVKTYCDNGGGIYQSGLGSTSSRSENTSYQASTDGFFIGIIEASNSGYNTGHIMGYTDTNATPSTRMANANVHVHTGQNSQSQYNNRNSFTLPVRSGEYYRATYSGTGTITRTYYWIPLS